MEEDEVGEGERSEEQQLIPTHFSTSMEGLVRAQGKSEKLCVTGHQSGSAKGKLLERSRNCCLHRSCCLFKTICLWKNCCFFVGSVLSLWACVGWQAWVVGQASSWKDEQGREHRQTVPFSEQSSLDLSTVIHLRIKASASVQLSNLMHDLVFRKFYLE